MSSWSRGSGVIDIVPKGRVIVNRDGRLVSTMMGGGVGNRISQILAGLGYAERTGRQFVFYEQHMTHNPHTPAEPTKRFLLSLFPHVKVLRGGPVSWRLLQEEQGFDDVSGAVSVVLSGYYQEERYYPSRLREWFSIPKPPTVRFSGGGIPFERTWFVHFRFGDYVTTDFNVDLRKYYKAAIASVLEEQRNAFFLLFSDEPTKIPYEEIGLSGFSGEKMSVVPYNIGIWESLWQMSRCWGGVTANSSFSWSAAFAVKGSVYMPTVWKTTMGFHKDLPSWVRTVD